MNHDTHTESVYQDSGITRDVDVGLRDCHDVPKLVLSEEVSTGMAV
jgi:hypothetical protein